MYIHTDIFNSYSITFLSVSVYLSFTYSHIKLKVKEELCRAQQRKKVKAVFSNGKIFLQKKNRSQDEGRHCEIVPASSHPHPYLQDAVPTIPGMSDA